MINVCVNGLFRYDQYVRYIAQAGCLGRFYYSHRIDTNAERLGIRRDQAVNVWFKEYGLHGLMRLWPSLTTADHMPLYDLWQKAVLTRWRDADTTLAVIGETADHVLTHAKRRGSRAIGHAVNSHPQEMTRQIFTEHALLGLPPPFVIVTERRMEEIALCDEILVDSSYVARSFAQNGTPASRIRIITPGADRTRFRPRHPGQRDRTKFKVVTVGSVNPRKGHRYLLDAWKLVGREAGELIIVGGVSEHTREILAPYDGWFTHIPRVANASLRDLLVTASVFVLPSVEDGFAQAAMEALSCGVPVICTDNAGIADLIQDGVNGWVVEARDPEAIAERLLRLMLDPDLAVEMGVNAARLASMTSDWCGYVDRLLNPHRLRPVHA